MTSEVALGDSKPDGLGAPTPSGLQFSVPVLEKPIDGTNEAEILLLGWCLLLHRYSTEGDGQFAWGICDNGGLSNPTFELGGSAFAWTPEKLLSEALVDIQAYIAQHSTKNTRLSTSGTSLFFNDEPIPDNLTGNVSWDGNPTAQWVRNSAIHCESTWIFNELTDVTGQHSDSGNRV
jgi:hypothetical protein